MDNIKYTSLPSEEEMRLFLELGRRLRIFDSVLIKNNQILYESIIAVCCLICFVRWLFQDVNTKEKNDFLIKKDIWTNAELQNYVRFKSLDFLEEVAKKKNLPFSLSLAEIGRKNIKEHDYYPFVTIDSVIEEDSYYRNINDHDRISVFLIHHKFGEILGTKKILYLRDLGPSDPDETRFLTELLPGWEVIVESVLQKYLKDKLTWLCELEKPDLIIGAGIGSIYAQQMQGYKRICINPVFHFDPTMYQTAQNTTSNKKMVFTPQKWTLFTDISEPVDNVGGEITFYNYKSYRDENLIVTPEIIQFFDEMEAHQFDSITDEDRENVYGLFADNDTTVNCEDIFRQHYKNVTHFHGEHRLNRQVIEEVLVPLIKEIVEKSPEKA